GLQELAQSGGIRSLHRVDDDVETPISHELPHALHHIDCRMVDGARRTEVDAVLRLLGAPDCGDHARAVCRRELYARRAEAARSACYEHHLVGANLRAPDDDVVTRV